ncbi:TolB family protein [Sphingomonas panacisoli]|uniref:TolB family protein n=1 Tax=Sphingomonas panacisoli TaxID=1813879 RepID=UPI0016494CEF|nr:PD40 domain-containing protein [Sphingomonas panacisoli]
MANATIRAACIAIVVALSSSTTSAAVDEAARVPRLVAPGVISTPDFEYDTSFTPDGKTMYFTKGDPGYNRLTIVESRLVNGRWTQPRVASFSGIWKDADAHVSADGTKLYFISNRPADNSGTPRKDYDIWFVERSGNGWGAPQHLPAPINTDGNEAYANVLADGTLYFEASRAEHPGIHIYRARPSANGYDAPELLSFAGKGNDINPVVARDGGFLIFASRDRGGMGQGDLFVSFARPDGRWSDPVNLGGTINTAFGESAPWLSPDGRRLFFSSNRLAGPVIRERPADYAQLGRELRSNENGLLSIYEVTLGDIRKLDRP